MRQKPNYALKSKLRVFFAIAYSHIARRSIPSPHTCIPFLYILIPSFHIPCLSSFFSLSIVLSFSLSLFSFIVFLRKGGGGGGRPPPLNPPLVYMPLMLISVLYLLSHLNSIVISLPANNSR